MNKKQISQLPDLKARKNTVTDQLKNLQATSEGVSEETVKQLDNQYKEELEKLELEIADLTVQVKGEQERLRAKIKELGEEIAAKDKELAEAEVLSKSGAMGDDNYRKQVKSFNQAKNASQKELAKAEKDAEWLNQCLSSDAALKGGHQEKKSAIIKLACLGIAGVFCLFVFIGIASAVLGGIFGDKSAYKLADKYPDAQKRIEKVQKLEKSEELALVILMDPVERIRDLALEKIIDQQVVWNVLKSGELEQDDFLTIMEYCDHEALRAYAIQQLWFDSDVVGHIKNDPSEKVRLAGVEHIKTANSLKELCLWWNSNSEDREFCEEYQNVARAIWKKFKQHGEAYGEFIGSYEFKDIDRYVFVNLVETIDDQKQLAHLAENAKSELIRRNAVEKLTDQKMLASLVKKSPDAKVRYWALNKIDDPQILLSIVKEAEDKNDRTEAVRRIEDQRILLSLAKKDNEKAIRLKAISGIEDSEALLALAKEEEDAEIRQKAIANIHGKDLDQKTLAYIAVETYDHDRGAYIVADIDKPELLGAIALQAETSKVRKTAAFKIPRNQQAILKFIAEKSDDKEVRKEVVKRIRDQEFLSSVVLTDKDSNVCYYALERIHDKDLLFKIVITFGERKDLYSETCKAAATKLRGLDEELFLKFLKKFNLQAK